MPGRLHSALSLILVLGLEQGSSSVLNDPGRFEGDIYTIDELNDLDMEQKQDSVPADVCTKIKAEFKDVEKKSMAEARREKPDSYRRGRKVAYTFSVTKYFQILQHCKSSLADDSKVFRTLQNEACVNRAIGDICKKSNVLNLLGIAARGRKGDTPNLEVEYDEGSTD
ncbi:hypothetical protein AWC38_SpisGene15498 [Stylophora pistillata]|uniref:Uncharacterized protein n=1 Tax=Stylophora pistillata TaxID=50429 RepID=A0A2B4RUY7_STYPI|nr:hypothetical protein AWC38_SpisGene15498 [Stylophora pistillata]